MKTLLAATLALLSAACATTTTTQLQPCDVPGIKASTRCASVSVPESRKNRGTREIGIHVIVIPAAGPTHQPDPIVVLGGGPGQSGQLIAPVVSAELADANKSRDLVFVDQRGTGKSNPLNCTNGFQIMDGTDTEQTKRCIRELATSGDLAQYTTDSAADDLHDVISSLGYSRVNLVAGSYGTRLSLVFAQRYPRQVRTMTLRALAPAGFNILQSGTMNLAFQLERLFADCAADARCHAAYPNLRDDFYKLRAKLAAEPLQLPTVKITRFLLDQTIYALMLSAPSRQQVPFIVTKAASGDYSTLGAVAVQLRDALYGTLPVGMYLSIVCTEDAPRLTAADIAEMDRTLEGFATNIADACREWSRGRVAPELTRPAKIDTPTLVISGGLDPATPPASAEKGLPQLARSKHVVVPTAAHGPMFPGCVKDIVTRFIETMETAVDASCAAAVPLAPFAVPPPTK